MDSFPAGTPSRLWQLNGVPCCDAGERLLRRSYATNACNKPLFLHILSSIRAASALQQTRSEAVRRPEGEAVLRSQWLLVARYQLSSIPLSLKTWPQRTNSLRTNASNSAGVLVAVLMPDLSSLSAICGSA